MGFLDFNLKFMTRESVGSGFFPLRGTPSKAKTDDVIEGRKF